MMREIFVVFTFAFIGLAGAAYAEPLEQINTKILESPDDSMIQISWNHDASAASYDIGCVSCMPNIVNSTENDTIIIRGLTALNNGNVVLFVIAYDASNDIITAKQVIVEVS